MPRILRIFKKANKGQKGQIKGRIFWNLNFLIFLTCIGSFGYARPHFAAFSKFQDQKGQKGRNSKSNLKIIIVQLFLPKSSVVSIFIININSSHPILIGQPKKGDFKGQNVQNDSKNGKICT